VSGVFSLPVAGIIQMYCNSNSGVPSITAVAEDGQMTALSVSNLDVQF
jgi:hypothetical protein